MDPFSFYVDEFRTSPILKLFPPDALTYFTSPPVQQFQLSYLITTNITPTNTHAQFPNPIPTYLTHLTHQPYIPY